MLLFPPKQLNLEQQASLQNELDELVLDIEKMEVAVKEMGEYYDENPQEIKFVSHACVYAYLRFSLINDINGEDFPKEFERTVIPALLQDFNVVNKFLGYGPARVVGYTERSILFADVKRNILSSNVIVSQSEGMRTLGEVMNMIVKAEELGKGNLEMANLYSELESKVFKYLQKEAGPFISISGDEFVRRLLALTHFFIGVDEESYNVLSDAYSRGQLDRPDEAFSKEPIKNAAEVVDTLVPTRPPYAALQETILKQFPLDDTGHFVHLDDLMNYLQQLSEYYNNDQIMNLYYYDEATGDFVWNGELLEDA